MRAYSWFLVGSAALACSGGAFTSVPEGSGGSGTGDGGDSMSEGASAGVLGLAGRGFGGSLMGGGGKVAVGGTGNLGGSVIDVGGAIGFGGDLGIAGDLVAGGSLSMGGGTVVGGTGTSGGAVGTGGTGPDPGPGTCPVTVPPPDSMCVDGLSCSYSGDVRTNCRPQASCAQGAWVVNDPGCKAIHGCGGSVAPGNVCDPATAASCIFNGYRFCTCSLCSGNVCSDKPSWRCALGVSGANCPDIAPNVGTACTTIKTCQYGSCDVPEPGPIKATCNGETWSWEPLVCAF